MNENSGRDHDSESQTVEGFLKIVFWVSLVTGMATACCSIILACRFTKKAKKLPFIGRNIKFHLKTICYVSLSLNVFTIIEILRRYNIIE